MTKKTHISNLPPSPEPITTSRQLPKQPWHKPTVTFVSLQATAIGAGSQQDVDGFSSVKE